LDLSYQIGDFDCSLSIDQLMMIIEIDKKKTWFSGADRRIDVLQSVNNHSHPRETPNRSGPIEASSLRGQDVLQK